MTVTQGMTAARAWRKPVPEERICAVCAGPFKALPRSKRKNCTRKCTVTAAWRRYNGMPATDVAYYASFDPQKLPDEKLAEVATGLRSSLRRVQRIIRLRAALKATTAELKAS